MGLRGGGRQGWLFPETSWMKQNLLSYVGQQSGSEKLSFNKWLQIPATTVSLFKNSWARKSCVHNSFVLMQFKRTLYHVQTDCCLLERDGIGGASWPHWAFYYRFEVRQHQSLVAYDLMRNFLSSGLSGVNTASVVILIPNFPVKKDNTQQVVRWTVADGVNHPIRKIWKSGLCLICWLFLD